MNTIFSINQLDLLFKNSSDAVFFMERVDDQYRYIYVNEAAIELINVNPTGKLLEQVVPSHLAKPIIQNYNLTIQNQKQMEYEDYTYDKMEVRKQRTTSIPIIINEKTYVLAITKEVSLGRDLEDKYLFMRSLHSSSFISTLLVSNDMHLLEANPTFIHEFNICMEDALTQKLFEMPFMDGKSVKHLKKYIKCVQNGESIQSQMLYFIDKNNERRCFTASFSSLTSNDETIAVFIMLHEITEFIKQQQALRTASHGLEMFKNAISSVADVIFTDVHGVITDINDRIIKNTGYSREEIIGNTHHIFNSGTHNKEFFQNLWSTVKDGNVWRDEVCNRKKNGEIYWVDSTIVPLKNEFGEIEQYFTVQYNISSEKQLLSELYKIERIFRAITDNTNDFIVVTDRYGKIKYASPSYIRKLGYEEDELIGAPYEDLLMPESIKVWKEALKPKEIDLVEELKIELLLHKKDNSPIWTEGNYTMSLDLSHHEISEIVMVSREITERKELEDQLTYLAYHDSLTQLGNRRKLYKDFPLIQSEAKHADTSLAIFYLDGDNFKQVNDLHGHDVGDEFLIQFGNSLVKSVRQEDLVVRLGGDEFLIVFTGLSNSEIERTVQIEQIMNRIQENLEIGWRIRGVHFSPTVSIGISIYPQHSESLDELIDLADQALYQAKQSPQYQYCISNV
ncbi:MULTISPECIES: diguanylate cyclase domain-containing protein [unclassified Solibacillus]|uniref:diguanylate cyclase domain-containing protein n=1 Tax=unclassified Solibacillus TaxID=2637870 RepID=UPI0030F9F35E